MKFWMTAHCQPHHNNGEHFQTSEQTYLSKAVLTDGRDPRLLLNFSYLARAPPVPILHPHYSWQHDSGTADTISRNSYNPKTICGSFEKFYWQFFNDIFISWGCANIGIIIVQYYTYFDEYICTCITSTLSEKAYHHWSHS